ncbi:GNAT family N-acetyltransferase [Paraflavitalea speifideaquila]|uniref:GNAT family N-acetyltransferase n=1 Tax=Paraflavitalea speifideaquila TaxID=3076558 RepID=UPI0028E53279|nr:GNAT family N-acetyltransferase [Paraflavitalea speifideiaquila]
MYQISLIPKDQLHSIIPFLRLLNNAITEDTLQERLADMMQRNYECAGVYDNDRLIGICGLWILNKYYVGKHIEPDNVMVLPEYRNKGVGEEMMAWVYEYGRSQGCIASELNCYVVNDKGIRFWLNQGYKIIGFHCQKQLQ